MSLKSLLFPSAGKPAPDSAVSAPTTTAGNGRGGAAAQAAVSPRKRERNAHREQLYGVVRESMLRAGVLSSGYKFKALSLDGHGHQFLVMVDLLPGTAAPSQPWSIEQDMAQAAQQRHGIDLVGVYWRMRDQSMVPAPGAVAAPVAPPGAANPTPAPAADMGKAVVEALHKALDEADRNRAAAMGFDGQPVHGPQSYTLLTGFEDTEIADGTEDLLPPLGKTQYGQP